MNDIFELCRDIGAGPKYMVVFDYDSNSESVGITVWPKHNPMLSREDRPAPVLTANCVSEVSELIELRNNLKELLK